MGKATACSIVKNTKDDETTARNHKHAIEMFDVQQKSDKVSLKISLKFDMIVASIAKH